MQVVSVDPIKKTVTLFDGETEKTGTSRERNTVNKYIGVEQMTKGTVSEVAVQGSQSISENLLWSTICITKKVQFGYVAQDEEHGEL